MKKTTSFRSPPSDAPISPVRRTGNLLGTPTSPSSKELSEFGIKRVGSADVDDLSSVYHPAGRASPSVPVTSRPVTASGNPMSRSNTMSSSGNGIASSSQPPPAPSASERAFQQLSPMPNPLSGGTGGRGVSRQGSSNLGGRGNPGRPLVPNAMPRQMLGRGTSANSFRTMTGNQPSPPSPAQKVPVVEIFRPTYVPTLDEMIIQLPPDPEPVLLPQVESKPEEVVVEKKEEKEKEKPEESIERVNDDSNKEKESDNVENAVEPVAESPVEDKAPAASTMKGPAPLPARIPSVGSGMTSLSHFPSTKPTGTSSGVNSGSSSAALSRASSMESTGSRGSATGSASSGSSKPSTSNDGSKSTSSGAPKTSSTDPRIKKSTSSNTTAPSKKKVEDSSLKKPTTSSHSAPPASTSSGTNAPAKGKTRF